jgi:hypothetical protein
MPAAPPTTPPTAPPTAPATPPTDPPSPEPDAGLGVAPPVGEALALFDVPGAGDTDGEETAETPVVSVAAGAAGAAPDVDAPPPAVARPPVVVPPSVVWLAAPPLPTGVAVGRGA